MNISELNIRRPVMSTLVMVSILLAGVIAYRQLPVNDLPTVDFPTIQVSAALPGANPDTMASSVATPLERQFSTISGLDSMSSTSSLGTTSITLQFNLSRNIDAAAQDVQAAISQAARQLPPELPNPPIYQKVNPADQPIIYIGVTSATLPMWKVDEYAETTMAQRLSMVTGVSQVQVFGSQKYAVRVQVDPSELASRGIGINEVSEAITAGNVNLPTGILYGPRRAYTVQTYGQLMNAAEYRPLVVTYRNGAPVRLEELGRVIDSVENDKTIAWYITPKAVQPAVVLAVQRQPGTNTVQVARDVLAVLPQLRAQIPAAVQTVLLYDRSVPIENSVHDVEFTLVLTLCLVVLVIFLFLRNGWATIIPSLALPMSVVGTFGVMYLLDYSLNNLTLMALTLSVGFVVDDAIVMLENIVRHQEMGKGRLQASLDGSREIVFTIVSMTISLAAVFIPVLLMGGLVGRLFREFAVTIGAAVLISGFVSLTLTPMLSSRFLRAPTRHGRLYLASERVFTWMVGIYGRTLRAVLRHPPVTVVVSVVVLAGLVWMFAVVPTGFLPSEDRGQVFGFTEAEQGVSFEAMKQHQLQVARVIAKDPNVEALFASAGARGGSGGNTGFLFVRLRPRGDRPLSADELIVKLRPELAQVPGVRVYLQNPPPIPVGGRLTKGQYQYTLQSPDTATLYKSATELEAALRRTPGLLDVNSDLQVTNPQVNIRILRNKAATVGVTAAQIEDALYSAYGSRQVSTILTPTNQYQVILEVLPQYQLNPQTLSLLYIRPIAITSANAGGAVSGGGAPTGAGSSGSPVGGGGAGGPLTGTARGPLVPLDAVASVSRGVGPLLVNHSGQSPSVTISFNLDPQTPLSDATREVSTLAARTLPSSITTSFQGTAQAFQSSQAGLGLLLIFTIVVIYIVLGILYESFVHPLTILTALPLAGFGALLTLMVFRTELSLYAFVGIIMLVGLVKKNGIMMIDFALQAQREGVTDPGESIFQACLVRFRPIMMTTFAALMAGLPIAIGWGAGAESRRPLGLAVVGGLLFSQTLTLYVTPVFYVYFERLRRLRASKASSAPSGQT